MGLCLVLLFFEKIYFLLFYFFIIIKTKKYLDFENFDMIFILLFTKDEILYGKSYETFHAERYLKTITENHFICDFEKMVLYWYYSNNTY